MAAKHPCPTPVPIHVKKEKLFPHVQSCLKDAFAAQASSAAVTTAEAPSAATVTVKAEAHVPEVEAAAAAVPEAKQTSGPLAVPAAAAAVQL